ncbi:unnamed protein product [Tilletia controversa]|nr:unnamed protein product [Tilletia controversa]
MPYRKVSEEVKQLAVKLVVDGQTTVSYLDRHGVISASTFYRYFKIPRSNRRSPGRPRKLHHTAIQFLHELILRHPDLYLDEIADILHRTVGTRISISTIHRSFKRAGITLKRAHRIAQERSETKRRGYILRISKYETDQLVFADETSYDARDAVRFRARSTRNSHARLKRPYRRGGRLSCIAALSADGLFAPWAVRGAFNGDRFCSYLRTELLPQMQAYPAPNSVLIFDNASFHKSDQVKDLIESFGCKLELLPPYSPDYNPIERSHSKIKSILRRDRATKVQANHFYNAVEAVTADDCRAWMRLAGYF